MARNKVLLLSALTVLLVSLATGLSVNINIGEVRSHGAYDFNYSHNVTNFQEVTVNVENLGSIGCGYRLEAVHEGENLSQVSYSDSYDLWPGETALMTSRFLPLNYSGQVNTEVYLNYCGSSELIETFNYTVERKTVLNNSVETRTASSNEESANVRVKNVEEGYMLPEKAPAGWKVSSTEIREGKADLSYSAPIFDHKRDITYKVLDSDGEPIGTAKVNLKAEPTVLDKLNSNRWKLLLGISVLFNLILAVRMKSNL